MRERDDSIMTDLFEGQLMSSVTCLSCNYKSASFDNYMDLSVELPRKSMLGSLTLQDCLGNFFTEETMKNSGYKCEGCKKKVNIQKDLSVYSFPRLLIITLKRFSQ
jgi:ubiquitin carboxyl-terminal hydrolase 8